ncbi:hypothetical protein GCM10011317_25990 [Niveispirillum cyanobacteriorum]|nr:hypothetical protein GCM10011317_25990 [Niveispirillum cyanobacteriorum]
MVMFSVGFRAGFITVSRQNDVITLLVTGEVMPVDVDLAIEIGHELGIYRGCRSVLIDLRRFVGVVDWGVVRRMGRYAPWVHGSGTKLAYLLREEGLALMAVTACHYPRAHHNAFRDEGAARAWLREEAPLPRNLAA